MRWLSPPDSVPEARPSVRYSSPTSTRKVRRSRISLRIRTAISFCFADRLDGSSPNQRSDALTESAVASPMSKPAILTASASGLRRRTPHATQGVFDLEVQISAGAAAGDAGRLRHVARDLVAGPVALGLLVAALEVRHDALERLLDLVGAQA